MRRKMFQLMLSMFLFFGFIGIAGCAATTTIGLDGLAISAADAFDVPAGTYVVPFTIADLDAYVDQHGLSVTITAVDRDGVPVAVTGAALTVVAGQVYTVTIVAWVQDEAVRTKTVTVTAVAKTAVRIDVTTPPVKTDYVEGQSFDPAGMVVTVTYSDASTAVTNDISYATDPLATTDASVVVTHVPTGLTASVAIEVIPLSEAVWTVTFDGAGGQLVSGDEVQSVHHGESAVAPVYAKKDYLFDGFDVAFDVVTADLYVTARWIDPSQGTDGLDYTLDPFTYTYQVSGYWGSASTVVVPATHDGHPVTRIGNGAFQNNATIRVLELPAGITSIGVDPFRGAVNLEAINVAADNPAYASIDGVLYDATATVLIRCPEGKTGTVTIPDGVVKLAAQAFVECVGVDDIRFPDTLVEIPADTFYHTTWLDDQPDGIVYAGKVAYLYVGVIPADTTITLAPDTIGIGGEAFAFQDGIVAIDFPDALIAIGDQAFAGLDHLTGVIFPDGLKSIGAKAFEQCGNLINLSIPDSLERIGAQAFQGTAWYAEQPDGVIYVGRIAYAYKGVMPAGLTLSLVPGTTAIADYAFYAPDGSTSLVGIQLPSSLTSIGEGAFGGCTGLTMLQIPASVTSIGAFAFLNTVLDLYAEVASKPTTWNVWWNYTNRPVFWNCMSPSYAFTYTFDTAGGAPIDPIVTVFLAHLPTPVRTGYDFLGWYETPTYAGTPVTAPYYPESKQDATLYAKWELSVYHVEFITDGWTVTGGGDLVQNIHYGDAVTPPLIARDGYLFIAWNADLGDIAASVDVYPVWARITASTSGATSEGVWIAVETSNGGTVELDYGTGAYVPYVPGSSKYLTANATIRGRIAYLGGDWIAFVPFVVDNIDATRPSRPEFVIRDLSGGLLTVTIVGGTDAGGGVLRHEYRVGDDLVWIPFATSTLDLQIENGTILTARTFDLAENASAANQTWLHVEELALAEDDLDVVGRFVLTTVASPNGTNVTTTIALSGAYYAQERLYQDFVSYPTGTDYRGCGVNAGQIFMRWFGRSLPLSWINDSVETTDFGKYLEWLTENTWADPSIFTTPAQLVSGLQELIDETFSGYDVIRRSPESTASAIAMIESALVDGFPVAILVNDGAHWQIISESIVVRDANGDIVSAKFLTHDNGGSRYRTWSQLDYFFEDNWDAEVARAMDYTSYVDTIITIRRDDAIQTENWSSGWASAEFFQVDGNHYVFLSKTDGTVHVNRVNADGTIGEIAQTYSWSEGWDYVSFYEENGVTYLVLFKSGSRLLHIRAMNADGSIGELRTDTTFPASPYGDVKMVNAVKIDGAWVLEAAVYRVGDEPAVNLIHDLLDDGVLGARLAYDTRLFTYAFTQAAIFEAYGNAYVINSDASTGVVMVYRIDTPLAFGERIATYHWTEGWTNVVPFTVGGEAYLLISKSGVLDAGGFNAEEYGLTRIHRINPDGTIGVIVDRAYWPPTGNFLLSFGYNVVRFYQNAAGDTFLLTLRGSDGVMKVYRIDNDGTIHSELS